MLAMDEAKLPPPTPARAAIPNSATNGSSGLLTAQTRPKAGRSNSSAEITVQLRPPKTGTAKVYGMRRVAPTRLGTDTSQNIWSTVSAKPALFSCGTTMLHRAHTANPRNSAKIDQIRLRRAMSRPSWIHWSRCSGFQFSIQRPGRWTSAPSARWVKAGVRDVVGVGVCSGCDVGGMGCSARAGFSPGWPNRCHDGTEAADRPGFARVPTW